MQPVAYFLLFVFINLFCFCCNVLTNLFYNLLYVYLEYLVYLFCFITSVKLLNCGLFAKN